MAFVDGVLLGFGGPLARFFLTIGGNMANGGAFAAGVALMGVIYAAVPDAVKEIGLEEFGRIAAGEGGDYLNSIIEAAFDAVGLDINVEDGLNPQTITAAINDGPLAGTGIQLSNIFDREACKRDVMRAALDYAGDAFGLSIQDKSAEGLKKAVKAEITRRVMAQLQEGGGEFLEAAPALVALARQLQAGIRAGLIDERGNFLQPGLMMDSFHVDLRERQQKYASSHSRRWEPK